MTDAPISKIFALPLRLGRGTINEAPIFDRHGELVGECVDNDCDERALAFIRAVNSHDELTASEGSTFEIAARLLKERDAANATIATLVDLLNEISAQDRRNFPPHGGHVAGLALRAIKRTKTIIPADGTCCRCGAAPRNASGLCATCVDEDAERAGEVQSQSLWRQALDAERIKS